MEDSSGHHNTCHPYMLETGFQGYEIPASDAGCEYVFSVVQVPNNAGDHQSSDYVNSLELIPENPRSLSQFVNVKYENTNDDIFHPDSTFRLIGYDTATQITSANAFETNTPEKLNFYSHQNNVHSSMHDFGENSFQPIFTEDDIQPLESPIYARPLLEQEASKRRAAKMPQALPLQKVSKRKASQMDPTDWDLDERDEEVIILMDGILTKVGKPSGPTSSGKILSTVQNCPITVKWLLENFESMIGQSLPRSFVYDQYVAHCGINKIDSVNAASFGKLIRSVFLGLRTRRLGTRGNSKYHYYGIKIKETSHLLPILNSIRAEQDLLNDTVNGRIRKRVRRTQSVYTGKHVKGLVIDKKVEILENLGSFDYHHIDISIEKGCSLMEGLEESSLAVFEDSYKRHCMKLAECFHGFKLVDVLAEISNFWRLSISFKRKSLEDYSVTLPKPVLFKTTSLEVTETFVVKMDLYTYQHIINILIPSVLRPLPLQMLQAVDNMIQDILGILSVAMSGYPKRIVHAKLRALTAFIRMWKQYSKMSQLSEFVELTLDNETSISAMRHSVKTISMELICDRAAVIVESKIMDFDQILKLMTSFSQMLQDDQSLEMWCEWAQAALHAVLPQNTIYSIPTVQHATADLHSCWLILSNLLVNAIREMHGSESSLFVPLLQWCGELMQYFRQRLLDEMKEIMPVTRFYIPLLDEDMSVSFMDKFKAKPLVAPVEEDTFPMPLFIPTSVRLLDNKNTSSNMEDIKELLSNL